MPVVCLVVMIGAIVGITVYNYGQNRHAALKLSDDLIQSLNNRIIMQ